MKFYVLMKKIHIMNKLLLSLYLFVLLYSTTACNNLTTVSTINSTVESAVELDASIETYCKTNYPKKPNRFYGIEKRKYKSELYNYYNLCNKYLRLKQWKVDTDPFYNKTLPIIIAVILFACIFCICIC